MCQIILQFRTGTIVVNHLAIKSYRQLSKSDQVLVPPYIIILNIKHSWPRAKSPTSTCKDAILRSKPAKGVVFPTLIPKLMALSKYTHRYSILAHRPITVLEIMDSRTNCQYHAECQGRILVHNPYKIILIAHKIIRKFDSLILTNFLNPCPEICKPRTLRLQKYSYHKELII